MTPDREAVAAIVRDAIENYDADDDGSDFDFAVADRLLAKWAMIELPEPVWKRVHEDDEHPDYPDADAIFTSGPGHMTVEVQDDIVIVHGPRVSEWATGAGHGFLSRGSAYTAMGMILAAADLAERKARE